MVCDEMSMFTRTTGGGGGARCLLRASAGAAIKNPEITSAMALAANFTIMSYPV